MISPGAVRRAGAAMPDWARRLARAAIMSACLQTSAFGADAADPEAIAPAGEAAAGHGDVWVAYQHLFQNGDWWDVGPKHPMGSVISNGIRLGVDYYFADRWEASVSVPFIQERYSGAFPHPVETLQVPHPHTVFVDDGQWHGTWADWSAGLSYHTNVGAYAITPSVTLYVPTHHYTFYGSATVGQDLNKLGFGIALQHPFEASNFYYGLNYQYVFVEQTLGINVNHNIFGGDLGYFVSPQLQVRMFAEGKLGNGVGDTQISAHCPPCADEYWYLHDKFRLENHFNVGFGMDYQVAERLTLSASALRMVWGESNLNLKWGADFALTRSF